MIRVVQVSTGTMDLATGSTNMTGGHTEIGPCNTPLFGREGHCRSCMDGWQVPGNRPASPEELQVYYLGEGK
jgi:hypothetical protein